jgi:hypothetical protein
VGNRGGASLLERGVEIEEMDRWKISENLMIETALDFKRK